MAPKNQISTAYSSSSSSNPRGRDMKGSTQLHSSTKSIFKDNNGRSSTSFKNSFTSDEFVDRRSGRLGVKEETTYCRTDKYDNKNEGYAHEYETKVRLKHIAYPKPCTTNQQISYGGGYGDDDGCDDDVDVDDDDGDDDDDVEDDDGGDDDDDDDEGGCGDGDDDGGCDDGDGDVGCDDGFDDDVDDGGCDDGYDDGDCDDYDDDGDDYY